MQYRVKWEIDIEAESPEEAASRALIIQRDNDPENAATVFDVSEMDGPTVRVDLSNQGRPEADYQYTPHEKQCAFIVDQLAPVMMADGVRVGPDLFRRMTLRLAELLANRDAGGLW